MNIGRREDLVGKANRFYLRYRAEVENLRHLVEVNLTQLCIAYTLNNQLPREALEVVTRVKPLPSFLDKLEQLGWPDFYYPTDIIQDLIGARVVCWFVDDCYGIQEMIEKSHGFRVNLEETEDFIANPKPSGYRSIHLMADFTYDSVTGDGDRHELTPRSMVCEIQIRTRLQDAFGQLTHDFPYKFPNLEVGNPVSGHGRPDGRIPRRTRPRRLPDPRARLRGLPARKTRRLLDRQPTRTGHVAEAAGVGFGRLARAALRPGLAVFRTDFLQNLIWCLVGGSSLVRKKFWLNG